MTTELAAVTVPSSSKSEEESCAYRLSRFDEASSSAFDVYEVCQYPKIQNSWRSNDYLVNSPKDSEIEACGSWWLTDICLLINSRFLLLEYRWVHNSRILLLRKTRNLAARKEEVGFLGECDDLNWIGNLHLYSLSVMVSSNFTRLTILCLLDGAACSNKSRILPLTHQHTNSQQSNHENQKKKKKTNHSPPPDGSKRSNPKNKTWTPPPPKSPPKPTSSTSWGNKSSASAPGAKPVSRTKNEWAQSASRACSRIWIGSASGGGARWRRKGAGSMLLSASGSACGGMNSRGRIACGAGCMRRREEDGYCFFFDFWRVKGSFFVFVSLGLDGWRYPLCIYLCSWLAR